jgi:hypothetical protein
MGEVRGRRDDRLEKIGHALSPVKAARARSAATAEALQTLRLRTNRKDSQSSRQDSQFLGIFWLFPLAFQKCRISRKKGLSKPLKKAHFLCILSAGKNQIALLASPPGRPFFFPR